MENETTKGLWAQLQDEFNKFKPIEIKATQSPPSMDDWQRLFDALPHPKQEKFYPIGIKLKRI